MTVTNRQMHTFSIQLKKTRLALTLAVGLLACPTAFAASFGHARILSAQGQPLLVQVPVRDLSAADVQSLSARPAAAEDWARAGLTPPVALDSLQVSIEPGLRPEGRVLRINSSVPFSGPLADLLLDVRTASGMQRYQVTLLTGARTPVAAPAAPSTASSGGSAVGMAGSSAIQTAARSIDVRRGDTMFAIARRHAVEGVTVYQMMMALQRTNPQAFIHQNVNLVKAGAQLAMPSMDELLAISDREARRQFQAHAAAFAAMRGRVAAEVATAGAPDGATARQGQVSEPLPQAQAAPPAGRGDHLQLSDAQQARPDVEADTRTSRQLARADAQERISQLEDNVQHLNEALRGQGEAARNAVIEGAKGIGDTISSVAQAIADGDKADPAADAAAGSAVGTPGSAGQAGAAATQGADAASPGSSTGPQGVADASGAANASGATNAGGTADAGHADSTRGAATGTAPQNGSASLDAGASSTADGQASAAGPSGQAATGAAASGAATPAAGGPTGTNPLSPPAASNATGAEAQTSGVAAKPQGVLAWFQEQFLIIIAGLLALVILALTWLLRRAGNTADEAYDAAQVTEAKVRDALRDIDLNLKPRDDGASDKS